MPGEAIYVESIPLRLSLPSEIFLLFCLVIPMSIFWIAVVSIHVLAAITWIGGMAFLSFVMAPLLRKSATPAESTAFFRTSARRFRLVVWGAIGLLLATGPVLLLQRNVDPTNPAGWPQPVAMKLGLVACLLFFTFLHDLYLGPMFGRISAMPPTSRTAWQQAILQAGRWLPRLSLLIAATVVVAAVVLARS